MPACNDIIDQPWEKCGRFYHQISNNDKYNLDILFSSFTFSTLSAIMNPSLQLDESHEGFFANVDRFIIVSIAFAPSLNVFSVAGVIVRHDQKLFIR